MRLVSVAVPVPQLDALTYALPDGSAAPALGARVLVPLGTRVMTGCVLAVSRRGAGSVDKRDRRRPGRRAVPAGRDRDAGHVGGRGTTPAASARRSPRRCRRAPGSRASGTRRSPTPAASQVPRPARAAPDGPRQAGGRDAAARCRAQRRGTRRPRGAGRASSATAWSRSRSRSRGRPRRIAPPGS